MTIVREVVHTDTIISNLFTLCQSWRQDFGCLNIKLPAHAVVYDVMSAIGIPEQGIRMVLGRYMDQIDQQPGDPVLCALCDAPATHLVSVKDSWRLACAHHAQEAINAGLTVICPGAGDD